MSAVPEQLPNRGRWAARYIAKFGVAVVCIPPGKKFPLGDGWNQPGGYFTDPAQAEAFYETHPDWNMGAVLGPSQLCSLDVDNVEWTQIICDEFGLDLGELAASCPTVRGNPARFRILFRAPASVELSRHALQWPDPQDPKKKQVVFELRAGLVQDVLPPSIHPDTGNPYVWVTPPDDDFPALPEQLLTWWLNWDVFKANAARLCPWVSPETQEPTQPRAPRSAGDGDSVIEAYNRAHDIEEHLARFGYKKSGKRFLSPHSATKLPGVVLFPDRNCCFIHHASDPLSDKLVDPFALFAFYEHGDDFKAAVKAAAKALGMEYKSRGRPPAPPALPTATTEETPPPSTESGEEHEGGKRLLAQFALVAGTTKVFDIRQQQVMTKAAFELLVGKDSAKAWLGHKDRKIIEERKARQLAREGRGGEELLGALERFVLLEGTSNVWDNLRRRLVALKDLKPMIPNEYELWFHNPARRMIRPEDLVFDPSLRADPETQINMFTGLPLKPVDDYNRCIAIDRLLWWLCGDDPDIVHWVKSWLAYPLQHLGAKMESAMLFHGFVQGAGKSLFFDLVMRPIYGAEYSATVGQHQLDSQYSDWRSNLLYCLFEEILSNSTKHNHMGTVKHMTTGRTQRIEKKFVSGWEEANRMNAVFLSNEQQPLPIEPDDRRFLVVWPPARLPDDIKKAVDQERASGGIEAWYGHLLNYRLDQDFNEHSMPPMTPAKLRLIEYGLPSWQVFYREWKAGRLEVPYCSTLTGDLYRAYVSFCRSWGEHPYSQKKLTVLLAAHEHRKENCWYRDAELGRKRQSSFFVIHDRPSDKTEEQWLSECVAEFRRHLRPSNRQDGEW